jgi:hypothetical protein
MIFTATIKANSSIGTKQMNARDMIFIVGWAGFEPTTLVDVGVATGRLVLVRLPNLAFRRTLGDPSDPLQQTDSSTLRLPFRHHPISGSEVGVAPSQLKRSHPAPLSFSRTFPVTFAYAWMRDRGCSAYRVASRTAE